MDYYKRRIKVKEFLYLSSVDAFITNHRPTFMYLSGFTGSTAILIITEKEDYLIVDGRYILRAHDEADKKINIVELIDKSSMMKKALELLKNSNVKNVGIEKNNLKVSDYLLLSESFKVFPFNYLIESIRSVKDENELQKIEKALRIAEKVLSEVEKKLYDGVGKVSEVEIANFIKSRVVEEGAQGVAFEPIVAFGKNTAFPHYSPNNVVLKEGDFVIIDMGAIVDYYHSDITRSFCVGKNKEFERLYNVVLEVQQRSIENVKAGLSPVEVYNIAVKTFEKYELQDKFVHGLGHGVGLEIHELPSLSSGGFGFLKNNNVVTIEPGVYIPEIGGIRIEDMVVVNDDKPLVLTNYKK